MEAVKNNRIAIIDYGVINNGVSNHLGVAAFAEALLLKAFE